MLCHADVVTLNCRYMNTQQRLLGLVSKNLALCSDNDLNGLTRARLEQMMNLINQNMTF